MLRIFANSFITHILYICVFSFLFLPCGTLFHILSAQVTWQQEEHPMHTSKMNRRSSLTMWGYEAQSYSSPNCFKMV